MRPTLTVYIDEAGDPGVRDGLAYRSTRHEWLCISAVVTRSNRDREIVDWVKGLRERASSTQSASLHYHKVKADRRVSVCNGLAKHPCRAFVLASHKSNLREYSNPRIGAMMDGGTFYNWCLRLLLERVTSWAETWQKDEITGLEPLRIVFAQRGHNWDHFFSYVDLLRMQKQAGTLFLKGPGLAVELLDRKHWTVEKAALNAGLQLADTVASSFYQAANSAAPNFDIEPACALSPIMPSRRGVAANYSVTLFPLAQQASVPEDARPIFAYYGYTF